MAKTYYQILGVSETANLEEIKKTYRKLAQQWHPDKWNTKSLKEREKANEMMQEINKAYEILSDEDKRKKYDLGETNFSYDTSDNFDWDNYFETERARLNTEAEKIRFQLQAVAYREVINTVGIEISLTGVYPDNLDSKLWEPYNYWQEKAINLKVIVDENGIDKVNSPLYKFQEEMINVIKKRKEELDNGINNPYVDKEKKEVISDIEKKLAEKGLKTEDLPAEYRNYRQQINSLPKKWKIRSFQDEINEIIRVSEKPRQTPFKLLVENIKKKYKRLKYWRSYCLKRIIWSNKKGINAYS